MHFEYDISSRESFNFLWSNCSLFGKPETIEQVPYAGMVQKVGAVALNQYLRPTGSRREEWPDWYCDGKTKMEITLIERGKEIFLTDNGITCYYVNERYGLTKQKVVEIIGRTCIADVVMMGDNICIKVADEKKLPKAKASLKKLTKIIEIYGGIMKIGMNNN